MNEDECKDNLLSRGLITSTIPTCPMLTPDIYEEIGDITDPCPFPEKPDGSDYLCYDNITDWANNWDHNPSTIDDGWFSIYDLPVPDHHR